MSEFKVGDVVRKGPKPYAAWPQIGAGTRGVVTRVDQYVEVHFDVSFPFRPDELIRDESADAVGRERVSEAEAQQRIWHYRDCYQAWTAAPDDDSSKPLYSKYREAERQLLALLTAAPPERHDAPGVGMSREDAEQLVDDYCGLEAQRRHLIALLTGQPDAGHDPDAADAGGE